MSDGSHTSKRTGSGERATKGRVLLVEDSADVRTVLCDVLVNAGYSVVEADNGHAAVVKALACRPDVVLMDISLPLMTGIRAARVLRSNERTRHVPLIALTGRPLDPHDRGDFDHVLAKPCLPETLLRHVSAMIARAEAERERAKG